MPIYITEYAFLPADRNGVTVMAGKEPSVAEQRLTISGTSAQSSAFNEQTNYVLVHTTEIACLKFGANPTAVNTEHRLAANETRFYGVYPGHKLAGITGT